MVYLDNSATTPVSPAVAQVIRERLEIFGNPSSLYDVGVTAHRYFEEDKQTILKALGAAEGELLITSCGTEGDNTAIFGAARAMQRRGHTVITTTVEHPAVARAMDQLEKDGWNVIRISPRDGTIRADDVVDAVTDDTVLISIMKVNNETGAVFPVEEIARRAKKKNPQVLVHCDHVQGFMKCPLRVGDAIDLVTVSGHKLHAPKGVGALYIRKGARILPLLYGGGQQKNMRPGTENTLLAAAFAEAVRSAGKEGHGSVEKLHEMVYSYGENTPGITVNSRRDSLPYIVNLSVEGIRSETMLHFLEGRGIYVSSGSACSRGKKSSVLAAFGIPDSRIDSALRISFSRYNTEEDVKELLAGLEAGRNTLQRKNR